MSINKIFVELDVLGSIILLLNRLILQLVLNKIMLSFNSPRCVRILANQGNVL
ncbi:uncharacterized protein METZ01_LOCUS142163 [marine metagenome]|uniref:Uncharacterized protein n=1 Tax=marine metagenome TaxID=408172 RepID=A0A381ZJE4_9ZZZZ